MRIGMNLLHAIPEIGGAWNYIENLLVALGEYVPENEYVTFVTSHGASLVPDLANWRKVVVRLNARSRMLRIMCENTLLVALVLRSHVQCLHWFANVQGIINVAPALVTVYDLQPFKPFTPFPWHKRSLLRWLMRRTAASRCLLLPMSRSTQEDLAETLKVASARMRVIPAVIPLLFKPAAPQDSEWFRMRYGLPRQFWLFVAHWYPHKNHMRLIEAYAALKADGFTPWPLVLRGDGVEQAPAVQRALEEYRMRDSVVFLPRIERHEMPLLFSAASALVFPSYYEGGGIPALEALACGCPSCVSDIPAMREFVGDAAKYFDPFSVNTMANAIRTFQQNAGERELCRRRGLEQVAEHRPAAVAARLVEAYRYAALRLTPE